MCVECRGAELGIFASGQFWTLVCVCVVTSEVKAKVAQPCPTLCDPVDYTVRRVLRVRILAWVAGSLLQEIFPTQGLNPGLLHCRWIL